MNLIDFYVVPHSQNWEFGKAVEKIVNAYSKTLELKAINDNQAILIENDSVRILK